MRFDVLLKEVNPLNFEGFFVFSSEKNPTSTALLSMISVMLGFLLLMILQLAPRKLSDTFEYLIPRPSLSLFVLSGFIFLPQRFFEHVFRPLPSLSLYGLLVTWELFKLLKFFRLALSMVLALAGFSFMTPFPLSSVVLSVFTLAGHLLVSLGCYFMTPWPLAISMSLSVMAKPFK